MASSKRRNRRCPDDKYGPCMEFVQNGPWRLRLDGRVGRAFTDPSEKYTAERGGHTIGANLRPEILAKLAALGRKPRRGRPRPRIGPSNSKGRRADRP